MCGGALALAPPEDFRKEGPRTVSTAQLKLSTAGSESAKSGGYLRLQHRPQSHAFSCRVPRLGESAGPDKGARSGAALLRQQA